MKNSTKKFARKPLALVLALLMIVCSAPWAGMVAFAAGGSAGLQFDYVDFGYEFDTGKDDEEGNSIMELGTYKVMAVTGYDGEGGDIVVPTTHAGAKVEYIAPNAFVDCDNITSVTMPLTIKAVGEMAFANCTALQKVMFGIEGAQAASAFSDFSEYGYISQALSKTVGDKAFLNCTSLRHFAVTTAKTTLSVITTSFGTNVFLGCTNLTFYAYGATNIINSFYQANRYSNPTWSYVNLSEAVADTAINAEPASALMAISETKTIGVELLPANTSFTNVSYVSSNPEVATVDAAGKVTAVAYGSADITVTTFHGFTAVCRVNVADKIHGDFSYRETEDGKIEILGCNSGVAGEVVVPDQILGKTVVKIGENAFRNCTGITKVTVPATVTEIGSSAFYACTGLKEFVFLNTSTLKTIAGHAFYGCSSLSSISLPASLENIGVGAFRGCTALAAVIIDSNIKSLGNEAFMDCSSLVIATVKSSGSTLVYGTDVFKNTPASLVVYGIASSSTNTYATANSITFKALSTVAAITGISINAASTALITGEVSSFTAALVPAMSADVAWSSSDISVATVSQNGEVRTHAEGTAVITVVCANGVSDKKTITVANGVDGDYQFRLLNNNTAAQIVKYTGSATEIAVPASVAALGTNVPVTSVGAAAFRGASVKKVAVPASVNSISGEAFNYAYALEEIAVDAANTNYCAVNGVLFTADKKTLVKYPAAKSGDEYTVPGEVTTLGVCAFKDSINLINTELSENLKTISAYAFDNCLKLMNINVPASVTAIGDRAFAYCASLQYVTVPQSTCAFGSDVFKNSPEATLYGKAASDSETYATDNSVPFALISDLVEVTGITLSAAAKTLGRQDTYQLNAVLLPFGATYPVVTYQSNNPAIAAVDDTGLVTAIAEGTTTIVATTCKGISASCIITVSGDPTVIPELSNLEIKIQPDKTVYYIGETLDLTGIVVYAVYSNGDTEKIIDENGNMLSGVRVRGFDSNTAGEKAVEIIYLEKTVTLDVTVKQKEAKRIAITKAPDKLTYLEGERLDTTGMEVTVYYDDGSQEPAYDYTVSEFNSLPTGQKITVTYGEFSDYFFVTVIAKTLTGIKVTKAPDKTEYTEGEELDLTGLEISGIYNNGTSAVINDTPSVSGYSPFVIGKQTLTVSYGGFMTSFDITVKARTLDRIEILSNPNKTEYILGETLDITGMIVVAYFDNGTSALLSPGSQYEIDNYKLNLGQNDITISFGYADEERTASFTVWVMLGKSGAYTYKIVNGDEVCLLNIKKADAVGEVTVPSQMDGRTVTELAAGLYDGCDYMTGVIIPDTITKINEKAFANCDVLASAQLPNGLAVIPSQCFYNCPMLGEIEIPDTVTAIEDHAFAGCTELTKATIPASVVYIAPHAFRDCPNLTIWGTPESAAARYAAANGIPFRYLPPYIKGDVDGNGIVNATDARTALRVATKLETLDEAGFAAGDLNGDGNITAEEARTILRVATKLESF